MSGIAAHDPREEKAWTAFRDRVDAEDAKNMAHVRRKLKLTQKEAAEITGGGPNAFSRYERGKERVRLNGSSLRNCTIGIVNGVVIT